MDTINVHTLPVPFPSDKTWSHALLILWRQILVQALFCLDYSQSKAFEFEAPRNAFRLIAASSRSPTGERGAAMQPIRMSCVSPLWDLWDFELPATHTFITFHISCHSGAATHNYLFICSHTNPRLTPTLVEHYSGIPEVVDSSLSEDKIFFRLMDWDMWRKADNNHCHCELN